MGDTGITGKRIAIVGNFKIPTKTAIDLDRDGKAELFHENGVEGAFKSAAPHKNLPQIERIHVDLSPESELGAFKSIIERNNDSIPDNNVDLVIFSREHYTRVRGNPDKLHTKKAQKKMIRSNFDKAYLSTLEKLAKDAEVYVPAGNRGKSFFNADCMAKGVTCVGGEKSPGEPHPRSADNSLIDKWTSYEFEGDLINDKAGKPVGYDLHPKGQKGDNEADIIFGDKEGQIKLTGTNPPIDKIVLNGTSCSGPYQARKDLLQNNKK